MLGNVTDKDFEQKVLLSKLPVIVEFYAHWCYQCKQMKPALEMLAKDKSGKLLVLQADIEKCPDLVLQFGLSSLPSTLFFNKGEMVFSLTGAQTKQRLQEFMHDLQWRV